MTDRLNKTSICSIVFLDIIDYSKKPVSEQITDKELFNALINEALKNVAQNDRIILDTGDGAAITLMGSPEEALFIALTIRDGILAHNKDNHCNLRLRIGINLGSVRVVKDINDRPNIIGDGINVAQRIMSFAGENQILVSRSYFEVTSRLTSEITDLFTYSGVKQDKHIREHEVYSIKAKMESDVMPEAQFNTSSGKGKPDEVMLKDVLKPSNLIIALIASVLFILLGWYIFILKPALNESNPMDIRPTKEPFSNTPFNQELKFKSGVETQLTDADIERSNAAFTDKPADVQHKRSARRSESSTANSDRKVERTAQRDSDGNATQKVKTAAANFKESFLTPAAKPTCTQAQIAMNQCQSN
jgi:hypothetical protein